MIEHGTIGKILELARWAPSGDNTQPWRFEYVNEHRLVLHGFDTRSHCVYDLDGRPSQISLGAMVETLAIAATTQGMSAHFTARPGASDTHPIYDIELRVDPAVKPHPLSGSITRRSVQRRPMSLRRLTTDQKSRLESAAGPGYSIVWLEGWAQRFAAARLMFANAKLRLTMPEAFQVHASVIEWGARFSEDRIPDQALGASAVTTLLMRRVMHSWERVRFFNTYFAGTLGPRLEMDLVPGLACAAHFVIVADREPASVDDFVRAGRAVQRVWLTMTHLGLHQQPELTPLIFDRFRRHGLKFTGDPAVERAAARLAPSLGRVIGVEPARAVWMGRVGAGPPATARSTRLPVQRLAWTGLPETRTDQPRGDGSVRQMSGVGAQVGPKPTSHQ